MPVQYLPVSLIHILFIPFLRALVSSLWFIAIIVLVINILWLSLSIIFNSYIFNYNLKNGAPWMRWKKCWVILYKRKCVYCRCGNNALCIHIIRKIDNYWRNNMSIMLFVHYVHIIQKIDNCWRNTFSSYRWDRIPSNLEGFIRPLQPYFQLPALL